MKKHNQTLLSKLKTRKHKLNRSLIFAGVFGFIAVAIGLSQIFAQSSVAFLFSPYTQNANVNEDKSFDVTLYSNNQQVDGGSIHITYDSNLLSFVSFSDTANAGISINNRVSSTGNYSYDYQVASGSTSNLTLGSITFKARQSNTAQPAYIKFDAATTKAYAGTGGNRTYYAAGYGQAVVVVNASSPPTTPSPSSTPTAAPSANPSHASPSASSQPSSNQNPTNTSTPTSNLTQSNSAANPQAQSVQNSANPPFTTSPSSTNDQALTSVVTKPHKKSFLPFLFIGVGMALLGAAVFMFNKSKQNSWRGSHRGSKSTSHREHETAASDYPEENIIVKPSITPSLPKSTAETGATHTFPAIITQHAAHQHHKTERALPQNPPKADAKPEPAVPKAPESAVHKAGEAAAETPASQHPLVVEETITQVKERTDKSHHKEVEVDIVRLKPTDSEPQPAPAQTENSSPKVKAEPKKAPEKATVVAAQASHHNEHKPHHITIHPPEHRASAPKSASPTTLFSNRHVPDWQAQLAAQSSRKTSSDEPPDMFELAAEHPETFGSLQVLESEEPGNPKREPKQ